MGEVVKLRPQLAGANPLIVVTVTADDGTLLQLPIDPSGTSMAVFPGETDRPIVEAALKDALASISRAQP